MRAEIVPGSAGSFLDPPTYPTHSYEIATYNKNGVRDGWMSLTCYRKETWLPLIFRSRVHNIIKQWHANKPSLDTPEIREWVLQVLGYFRNCYKNNSKEEPECWHAEYLRIIKEGEVKPDVNDHAGVHLIRQFYPEYTPTEQDFQAAHWGKKPD